VIIITGSHDEERLDEAWAVGPQEVIGKPIDLERLLTSISLCSSVANAKTLPMPIGSRNVSFSYLLLFALLSQGALGISCAATQSCRVSSFGITIYSYRSYPSNMPSSQRTG